MIASLDITAAMRDGRTYLKKSFWQPPFKIADVTEDRRRPTLHLMQMSASPGVLAGDCYQIGIRLEEGAAVHWHTQSYQRLFSMASAARQQVRVDLAPGASFTYLPHPCVPQAGADFRADNRISLSANSRLIWGEIVTCGRKLNGEVFQFSNYRSVTEVFLEGKLILKENLRLLPQRTDPRGIGHLEGFTHQGGLICIDAQVDVARIIPLLSEKLAAIPGIDFGITGLPVNGFALRMLGNHSERLMQALKITSETITNDNIICKPSFRY
jgi:urease accessory protein